MASRASGVSAESHSDQSVASATSRRVAEPPAVPTVAPFEGFQFIQNLATQTSGRQASHESVGAWGVAALCGSAATTATLTAWVKSRSKAERDLPKGTHVRAAVVKELTRWKKAEEGSTSKAPVEKAKGKRKRVAEDAGE